jgi:hypothetical protein
MEKQIIIDKKTRTFLRGSFSCSRLQVWKALNFRYDSDLTRRIQKMAILKGGELIGCTAAEKEATMVRLGLHINKKQTFDSNEEDTNEERGSAESAVS